METQIKNILDDLYKIDPELKNYEEELKKMIIKLLKSKPDTKFDEKFIQKLKEEILKKADELKNETVKEGSSVFELIFTSRLSYALVGAVAMLILVIVASPIIKKQNSFVFDNKSGEITLEQGIKNLGDKAFGSLYSTESATSLVEGRGVGGGGGQVTPMIESLDSGSVKMGVLPPYDVVNYNFKYIGGEFNIDEEKMGVYKRTKSESLAKSFGDYLSNLNFDLVDIGKFNDLRLDNLALSENKDFGYSVFINSKEETISINQNWDRWPRPQDKCRDEACFEQFRLKEKDLPREEDLISIADNFLSKYNIDKAYYDSPIIQKSWERNYGVDEGYIPEMIQIVYPEKINGKIVYDYSSNVTGLYVSVDVRSKKAAGAYTITPHLFESSQYEIENNEEELIKLAEQGGLFRQYKSPNPTKNVDIELGSPEIGLIKYYNYQNNISEELYVPALIFPIISISDKEVYFYQQNIIVPLAKDIIENIVTPEPFPEPMPLIREKTIESSNIKK